MNDFRDFNSITHINEVDIQISEEVDSGDYYDEEDDEDDNENDNGPYSHEMSFRGEGGADISEIKHQQHNLSVSMIEAPASRNNEEDDSVPIPTESEG